MSDTSRYTSPFSERYASPEMQYIFSQDKKFTTWRKLWIALAETEMELGLSQDGKPVITQEMIDEVKAALESGEEHVFDTSAFTVDGEELDSYMADVDTDADYTPDTEVIADGYFHESEFRSAPYFDLQIDGITLLDTAF